MRYDFQCNDCHEIFEVSRHHDDTSPVLCPTCDSADTRKLILVTPLIYVSWRNTMGLGSSGQLVLPAVKNGRPPQDRKAQRKSDRRETV